MSFYSFVYHQLLKRHYFAITGPNRVLPDFLIIGAKRCGTTSLFSHLPEHPSIAKSHHDNMGFFNDNFHLGVNWYKSFFPTKSYKKKIKKKYGKFLTFDVTTTYMESKRTAENIIKIKPEIKIIVILRNPIDRAYSQFNVSVKEKTEELSFDDAINEEINRLEMEISENGEERLLEFSREHRHYIKKSLYAMQLKPWFEIFPRKNILVLSTEIFKENDKDTYKEIFEFLDIPEVQILNKQHMQKGEYSPMSEETRKKLRGFFDKYNTELFELVGKKFDWNY
tara:strand:+ start:460 stop:1302 length:843 start_codon:yes stop_codon:yes gene_type:complete